MISTQVFSMKDLEKEVVVMAATSTTYTFTGTLDVTESAAVGTSNSGAHPGIFLRCCLVVLETLVSPRPFPPRAPSQSPRALQSAPPTLVRTQNTDQTPRSKDSISPCSRSPASTPSRAPSQLQRARSWAPTNLVSTPDAASLS